MPFAYSVPTIVVVVMVVMVAVRARSNPDVNTGAMMVMMVMSDDNLGGADAAALCQPRIVGF
ncbi:MAG TPA: hypothetical protein VFK01_09330 [Bradyrhizobium sp.]|nr:hypothetical protein [Bradyrhizobium sp.]